MHVAKPAMDERQEARVEARASLESADFYGALQAVRRLMARPHTAADVSFAAKLLKEMTRQGAEDAGLKVLRTYIARSTTIEPVLPYIVVENALRGLWLDVTVGGYGSFFEELSDPEGNLTRSLPDLVSVLLDVEDIAGDVREACATARTDAAGTAAEEAASRFVQLVKSLRANTSARILMQGLVIPAQLALGAVTDANAAASERRLLQRVNSEIAEACREITDCLFFDADGLAGEFGRGRWRDDRMFYATRLAIAPEAFETYAGAMARHVRAMCFPPKKVLCTDLDNTLWGGILGEDGASGIVTGAGFPGNCYLAYQKCLAQLAARGVLLAIASKNDAEDVREAFQLRKDDMAVSLTDFAAVRIGWQEKSESLHAIAEELNLGLDSMVFVDDSAVECAGIEQQLADVSVVHVPAGEPWLLVPTVISTGAFDAASVTEDDRSRAQEYRAQAQRSQLESETVSRDDFLRSLGMVAKVLDARDAPLERAVQLLHKTNQFNLTTKRHSAADVQRFAAEKHGQAIALRSRDRFGDSGVVGVALCRREAETCHIDSFLLSCRVIGRGLETALLAHIARRAYDDGARQIMGEYIPTKKNGVCSNFYPDNGFEVVSEREDGTRVYRLGIAEKRPEMPAWIKWEE
jgi:FkbH-like protein